MKALLADKALNLAEKAVIQRVAQTYAPAAWFAAHQRPERAAILHVVNRLGNVAVVGEICEVTP